MCLDGRIEKNEDGFVTFRTQAAVSERRKSKYRKKVERHRKQFGKASNKSVRELAAVIKTQRAALMAELKAFKPPPGAALWREYQLPELIAKSDAIVGQMGLQYGNVVKGGQQAAAGLAVESSQVLLTDIAGSRIIVAADLRKLELLTNMGVDLISGVNNEVRRKIKHQLISGVAGQRSPWEIMEAIGGPEKGFLKKASIFRNTFYRAETIVRTEMGRVYNATQQTTLEQAMEDVDDVEKQWSTAMDGRQRDEHGLANEQHVKPDKPYIVGGEELMYPLDPGGSAWNTINCRCNSSMYKPEWDEK